MKKIKKILVANRGEIALRIIRSAREMDIKTVAVFSEADRESLHVRYADEAALIGPPPSNQSYLNQKKIIETAQKLKADAIHPGYGFLSENAKFAREVEKNGLIFIGPSSKSIRIMGDKVSAKKAVSKYNIPLIPGSKEAVKDLKKAKNIAQKTGYPILIKASAGGGGKGMRIVENGKDLKSQMDRAMSEAKSSFGDSSVLIEKYITSPRHIEFQILGDQHGNIVHLFERECSIQRRYQKVIEEAPSSVLTPELRQKMGEAAIYVAKSCDYYGAGTVEFIVDEDLNFYFLEMNTRLQVEHPVTEAITGLDLVKEQIRIAEGNKLSFSQDDLDFRGHAIESRIYAEDPANKFLPDIGRLNTYIRPQGIGVRLDDTFEQGMNIPVHYDPLIAKLVTFGQNRDEAIKRMIRALNEYTVTGVETNIDFCKFVMKHQAFTSGKFDVNFIPDHYKPGSNNFQKSEAEVASALVTTILSEKKELQNNSLNQRKSRWKKRNQ